MHTCVRLELSNSVGRKDMHCWGDSSVVSTLTGDCESLPSDKVPKYCYLVNGDVKAVSSGNNSVILINSAEKLQVFGALSSFTTPTVEVAYVSAGTNLFCYVAKSNNQVICAGKSARDCQGAAFDANDPFAIMDCDTSDASQAVNGIQSAPYDSSVVDVGFCSPIQ